MLSIAFKLFRCLPLLTQLGLVAAIIVGAGTATTVFYYHAYNRGWNAAIAGVASRNNEAIHAVRQAVSQADDCSANGGFWNTVSGVCD